jgi:hypothetical protein
MPAQTKRQLHAHDRARARGYEAARTGTVNPYAHGTQCWIQFERGKLAALNQPPTTKTTPDPRLRFLSS